MPGKKKQQASAKSKQNMRQKVLEDKTFGMKNKNKSKKVQKHIQTVKKQVDAMGKSSDQLKRERQQAAYELRMKKRREEQANAIDKDIFKVAVNQPKITQTEAGANVNPKSLLCQFFKAGACKKGKKCKFSHDLAIGRKVAKKDIYSDVREDTMANWDQSKLEDAVNKANEKKNRSNETQIICKYFIEALETKKYGWFWKCPNGNQTCIYKHKLPPGFVLKDKNKKPEEDEDESMTQAEAIEEKRAKLDFINCTPLTEALFAKWREDRIAIEKKKIEEKRVQAATKKKGGGRGLHVLSGRALFEFDSSLFEDDDNAAEGEELEIQSDEEDGLEKANVVDNSLFDDDEDLPDEDEE